MGTKVWAEVRIESNKYGSLTKTIMYLMQMQIAYCYVKYVFLIMFSPHSDRSPPPTPCGEYMLLEVLYGLNLRCVLFFIVLSYIMTKK